MRQYNSAGELASTRRLHHSNGGGCLILALVISLILGACTLANSQTKYKPKLWAIIPATAAALFDGVGEATQHHWNSFQKVHPNANPYYWNPDVSWKSKYKNNDPEQGPKFAGSTTALVGLTDFYHLRRTVNKVGILSTGLIIGIGERRKWWHYGLDILICTAANQIAFNIPYSLIYK